MSISCFQEHFAPRSTTFQMLLSGFSGFVGARLFEHCRRFGFHFFDIYKSKNGFAGSGHVHKSRKQEELEVLP